MTAGKKLSRQFAEDYLKAVQDIFHLHLEKLGFTLRKSSSTNEFIIESETCRLIFNPYAFIPFVQRIQQNTEETSPAYHLNWIFRAVDSSSEFYPHPLDGYDALKSELDQMVCVFIEECPAILRGEDNPWQRVNELYIEQEDMNFAELDTMGLHFKDGSLWREIPELNSVKVTVVNKLLNSLLAFVLLIVPGGYTISLVCICWMAICHPSTNDNLQGLLILILIGIPLLLMDVWIIRKILLRQYFWETNNQDLIIGGLLKKCLIPWSDIQSLEVLPNKGCKIETSQRRFKLDRGAYDNPCLEASIWQHMSRLGKAGIQNLSPFAASFWAQIPEEDVEEEIRWTNPNPPCTPRIIGSSILWIVVLTLLIIGGVLYTKLNLEALLSGIIAFMVTRTFYKLSVIQSITVFEDGFEGATGFGKQDISWESIKSANFDQSGSILLIHTRGLHYIRIPWFPNQRDSMQVVLKIIRQLRKEERFKSLSFPVQLLIASNANKEMDSKNIIDTEASSK